MASDKKIQAITAFNSGEYSDKLAGRVDIESFGKSSRFMSNFMAEPTGGIKKFYGTDFITEIEKPNDFVLVPFINKYRPMVLVIMPNKVGLISGDSYRELGIKVSVTSDFKKLRWQQINDRLIFVHETVPPFSIDFYGYDTDGNELFIMSSVDFDDEPYFPVGYTGDISTPLVASGLTGSITLSLPGVQNAVVTEFPAPLAAAESYIRMPPGKYISTTGAYYQSSSDNSVTNAKFEVVRVRDGAETVLVSGTVGVTTNVSRTLFSNVVTTNPNYPPSSPAPMAETGSLLVMPVPGSDGVIEKEEDTGGIMPLLSLSNITVWVFKEDITRSSILSVVKAGGFESSQINGNSLVLAGKKCEDILSTDTVYTRLRTYPMYHGTTQLTLDYTYNTPQVIKTEQGYRFEEYIDRRIKILMNHDGQIIPWWQGKTTAVGDIVYSNGHYYLATNAGECGNIQPSHTKGRVSDGHIFWQYMHSGSATGLVTGGSPTSLTITLEPGAYLPATSSDDLTFTEFQWSIWGKDAVYPSQIYMQSNRLGFICSTKSYGAWNSLSCSDDYFNFATEQYGQQLDTSAIVHLIPNNPDNRINWVLSFTHLYMGSYSGEFTITANNKVFTPTSIFTDRVSVLGGKDVMPLKYKELNLFVGSTGQELYTIGYDYTRDDYVPKSLGYLTEHLLNQGVARMDAINNRDQNVYLVHDNGNLSILNYVGDQNILGYSRVNLNGHVHDFCYTYAGAQKAAYVAVERREGYVCLEMLSLDRQSYMLSTEHLEFEAPTSTYAAPRFAGKTVYIVSPDGAESFVKVTWPEDGIFTFEAPVQSVVIGEEMVCELHTQPAFGRKAQGMQQQSIMASLRLLESGAFEYGASNDFKMMFGYANWGRADSYGEWHKYFTGDAMLNIPTGYALNANEGVGPYANSTGIGINIRATTPEPFNLLSITEVYE